jgi:hypothetical protein
MVNLMSRYIRINGPENMAIVDVTVHYYSVPPPPGVGGPPTIQVIQQSNMTAKCNFDNDTDSDPQNILQGWESARIDGRDAIDGNTNTYSHFSNSYEQDEIEFFGRVRANKGMNGNLTRRKSWKNSHISRKKARKLQRRKSSIDSNNSVKNRAVGVSLK